MPRTNATSNLSASGGGGDAGSRSRRGGGRGGGPGRGSAPAPSSSGQPSSRKAPLPLPPPPPSTSSFSNNPMHSNASSALSPSLLPERLPAAPSGSGGTGGTGGGYHRAPLKMPAGSNLGSKAPPISFGNPAVFSSNGSGVGGADAGGGRNGVLARNFSPERQRRPTSGGAAVRGG
ncbi:unnamed protein product, partial [Pylaiella littoralis]